jgi:hypothetical protein
MLAAITRKDEQSIKNCAVPANRQPAAKKPWDAISHPRAPLPLSQDIRQDFVSFWYSRL